LIDVIAGAVADMSGLAFAAVLQILVVAVYGLAGSIVVVTPEYRIVQALQDRVVIRVAVLRVNVGRRLAMRLGGDTVMIAVCGRGLHIPVVGENGRGERDDERGEKNGCKRAHWFHSPSSFHTAALLRCVFPSLYAGCTLPICRSHKIFVVRQINAVWPV
jgi:hypothetical protein